MYYQMIGKYNKIFLKYHRMHSVNVLVNVLVRSGLTFRQSASALCSAEKPRLWCELVQLDPVFHSSWMHWLKRSPKQLIRGQ